MFKLLLGAALALRFEPSFGGDDSGRRFSLCTARGRSLALGIAHALSGVVLLNNNDHWLAIEFAVVKVLNGLASALLGLKDDSSNSLLRHVDLFDLASGFEDLKSKHG